MQRPRSNFDIIERYRYLIDYSNLKDGLFSSSGDFFCNKSEADAILMLMKFYPLTTALTALLVLSPLSSYAQLSSEHNEKLKAAFEKYPQADLNGDGVLTWSEAKQYRDQTYLLKRTPKHKQ